MRAGDSAVAFGGAGCPARRSLALGGAWRVAGKGTTARCGNLNFVLVGSGCALCDYAMPGMSRRDIATRWVVPEARSFRPLTPAVLLGHSRPINAP